jgi:ADP-ribose pyrophosphatase
MAERKVELLSRETCFEGFFRLERLTLRHSLFAGGMSAPIRREVIERGNVAAVLLYDPDLDRVVLIEQFRVGALDDPHGPWLFEIVAGIIEPGETPEQVARREALEEAGCPIDELLPITRFYATPAKSSEHSWLFCGRVDATKAQGIHGLAHEGEDIRVHAMPTEDAFALLAAGRINSAWPMIALLWLERNRDDLRRRWTAQGCA